MRAGMLDRLVTLQAKSQGKNDDGDVVTVWSEVAKFWAAKRDISGQELVAAMSIHSAISVKFIARYRTDVGNGMRIVLSGEFYHVIASLDKRGDRDELQIYCAKGLIDGPDGE